MLIAGFRTESFGQYPTVYYCLYCGEPFLNPDAAIKHQKSFFYCKSFLDQNQNFSGEQFPKVNSDKNSPNYSVDRWD